MSFPERTPRWRRYLRFWRRDVGADIDDELRFHLDERVADLVARGWAPDTARRTALEELGELAEVRDALTAIDRRIARRRDRIDWLRSAVADLRYAARSLARTPMVAVTVVLTLALGLGANVAMFSLLDVLYLRPPAGVVDPGGVHRLWHEIAFEEGVRFWSGMDVPTYTAVRDALGADAATAIYSMPEERRLGPEPDAPRAMVSAASAGFFPLLGVRAERGRLFGPDEDRFGTPARVAVVSDAFWRDRLAADPAVLGRALTIGKQRYTIVGVLPRGFAGVELDAAAVWIPFAAHEPGFRGEQVWWQNRNVNGFQVLVRPRAGLAAAALDPRITRALHRPDLVWHPADTLLVARLGSIIRARGPGVADQEVRIAERLGGVAAIVLLIAIANVVNLLLARAVRRRREIAVRVALGISRGRLIAMLASESMLLALVAAAGAVLAAWWGGALLRALLLPDVHWATPPLHWRVLAFALLVSLAAGAVAGLVPAFQSADPDLNETLKAGAREGSVHRSRLRAALVVAQAALSMVLLVGAALFLESLANVRALDLGFDARRLLFASVAVDASDSVAAARLGESLRHEADRLRAAPGVEDVALTSIRPMQGFRFRTMFPDADTIRHRIGLPTFDAVSPEYFRTVGLRVLRGGVFAGSGSPRSIVVNQAMADGLWPGENPIGRCIRFDGPRAPCFAIVGEVETARRNQIIEDPKPQYYVPFGVPPFAGIEPSSIIVRAEPAVQAAVEDEIRQALRRDFPTGRATIVRMSDQLEPQYRPWKLGATLFTLFGLLALVVAAVGIYSTVAYGVSQRAHEFGVRIALGARTPDVTRQVVGEGMRIVAIGVIAGAALALATGRLVASLLYGIAPWDVGVMTVVGLVLVAIAGAAAAIPAWRASRVDPVVALRAD